MTALQGKMIEYLTLVSLLEKEGNWNDETRQSLHKKRFRLAEQLARELK